MDETDGDAEPARGFQATVGVDQTVCGDECFQMGLSRCIERDLRSSVDHGNHAQVCEGQSTEERGDRDARQGGTPDDFGDDHCWALTPELDMASKGKGQERSGDRGQRRKEGDLEG